MTALAFALGLCCAMVCGTALALRHMLYNREAALYSADARKALAQSGVAIDALKEAGKQLEELRTASSALRSEVDSLRAQVALRRV